MSSTTASLLMYRYGNDGLEVFLINQSGTDEHSGWEIPATEIKRSSSVASNMELESASESATDKIIQLGEDGHPDGKVEAWAFEESEDTFVLPLQSILGKTESPLKLRRTSKTLLEKGAFFCAKEAVKKVFPNQVAVIKELQEILSVRNIIKYL